MTKASDETGTYEYSSGYLRMVNEEDRVRVMGSFITQSQHSHSGMLTAGVLEVGGDFRQIIHVAYDNFKAGGKHRVVLNGDRLQKVNFSYSSSYDSCFNILEITNSSSEGVEFETNAVVVGELKRTETPVTGTVSLARTATIEGGSWGYDLIIEESCTLTEDMSIGGSLTVSDNLNINGMKLTVGKNISHTYGTITLAGGTVNMGGDFHTEGYGHLNMTDLCTIRISFLYQTF